MDWFLELEREDQEFIKQLVKSSGSLKELAKIYKVSYPTVRVRLDKIIQRISLIEQQKESSFETKIMEMVINDELSLHLAKKIIENYQEEKK
ncbi:DUF2089 family protein [Leuconostoc carnosum]|uniref:DUF2089 family protein n=1 Tax=Leuconostoc carnosum TaxID=1252 RepID=UPI0016083444|nr:DUF2089 family protein [Leuconostoc carnosum]MBB6432172.1 hypothetical protein [Leuconostoc carnosum]WLC97075.1 DUF2089 family protein [Leuconostoc carnosum]